MKSTATNKGFASGAAEVQNLTVIISIFILRLPTRTQSHWRALNPQTLLSIIFATYSRIYNESSSDEIEI